MSYWKNKKVIVTGGRGFLGTYIVPKLELLGARAVTFGSRDYDLTRGDDAARLFDDNPGTDAVIHMAARVGGIGANKAHPGSYFRDNLLLNTHILEQARLHEVPKFIGIGSVCSYPKFAPIPFKEEDLWEGYPEETNAPYGLSKKMMLVQSQGYRDEFGYNAIHLLMVNLYGPRDDFDPETSHVIPALIKKCFDAMDAGEPEIVCWGDGSPTREFLYADDAAEGILLAAEKYDGPEPVNLGSSFEISIKELSEMIARFSGFTGRIVWDTSKPNGQPRRKLDVSRAKKEFGFESKTTFEEGLQKTVDWYKENRANLVF